MIDAGACADELERLQGPGRGTGGPRRPLPRPDDEVERKQRTGRCGGGPGGGPVHAREGALGGLEALVLLHQGLQFFETRLDLRALLVEEVGHGTDFTLTFTFPRPTSCRTANQSQSILLKVNGWSIPLSIRRRSSSGRWRTSWQQCRPAARARAARARAARRRVAAERGGVRPGGVPALLGGAVAERGRARPRRRAPAAHGAAGAGARLRARAAGPSPPPRRAGACSPPTGRPTRWP